MPKILVTGAAGFMGSHLVDYLIAQGHEVFALDNLEGGKAEYVNSKADFAVADLRNKSDCEMIMGNKPEVIYHLAAHACEGQSVFNPIYTVNSNIIGFLNLFTSALNVGFETFVFTSSMAVYGNQEMSHYVPISNNISIFSDKPLGFIEEQPRQPVDPYGITKSAIERFLEIYSKEFGFNYVILRPHNVYGKRQSLTNPYRNVLGIWMNRIMHGKPPVIYGDGEQKRAFSYIDDCTPVIAKSAWTKETYGEIINIGSEEAVTINEACKIVCDAMGYNGFKRYVPPRPLEVKEAWCSSEKAKHILSYETSTSLKDGVKKMATWAKKQGAQPFSYWETFEIERNIPKVWRDKEL